MGGSRARLIAVVLAVVASCLAILACASDQSAYPLSVGDAVTVVVQDNPDLSGDFAVLEDGCLIFPLLGRVSATGLTTAALAANLAATLERDYLYDPVVTVAVKRYGSKRVKVLGNVTRPGTVTLDSPPRLLDVLFHAGGVPSQAGDALRGLKLRILRRPGVQSNGDLNAQPAGVASGGGQAIEVDIHDLLVLGREEANPLLEDGDLVYVPPLGLVVHVIGEVKLPGSLPFEDSMTALKAITMTGGPTKKASLRNMAVLRVKGGRVERIPIAMGDALQPGDIVDVPLSFW